MTAEPARSGHDWTEDEIIVTVYLYRFGWEDLGVSYGDLGKLMGRKSSTIIYRFANFLSYDGVDSGLSGGGQLAQEIYQKHRTTGRDELRRMAVHAVLKLAREV